MIQYNTYTAEHDHFRASTVKAHYIFPSRGSSVQYCIHIQYTYRFAHYQQYISK